MPTYGDIARFMEELAPASTAMHWDNVGLLVGSPQTKATGCIVALDVTSSALEAAEQKHANLIITHHPVIFEPLRSISGDGRIARLIRGGMGVLSAHTNLDLAEGGVNHALCAALGLPEGIPFVNEDGVGRIVPLPQPYSVSQLAAWAKARLSARSVGYCCGSRILNNIAVVSGAGGEYWQAAQEAGADALLTGEVKHHEWVDAVNAGFPLIAGGHFETEAVILEPLAARIIDAFSGFPVYVCRDFPVEVV